MKISKMLMFTALLLLSAAACKKENVSNNTTDAGSVPHKEVPDNFLGDFQWTQVSSSGYSNQYGGYYSALSVGVAAHLNKNGTGTWIYRYDITYANGGHKSVHVDSDVAYEITKLDASHANILIHFIRGKNYEDGRFLHDLDASVLYPNADLNWLNVEYGTDQQGRIYLKMADDFTLTKKIN